jgi:hypothetical protein
MKIVLSRNYVLTNFALFFLLDLEMSLKKTIFFGVHCVIVKNILT